MRTPRRSWLAALAASAALALGGVAGCAPAADPTPGPSGSGTGSGTGTDGGGSGSAAKDLEQLKVASAASMKGYSRDRFPHWRSAGKNCDVRDTVLKRDGKDVKLSGCNVVGGRWTSLYDNKDLTDPKEADIDHMVPLANAWRSGAADWDDKKRGDFANDTTRPQLFAVSATSNRAKGDQDPSQWKPPARDYWCTYAVDWITVKTYWKLTVTTAEKAALTDMLRTC
ncbi:HNH endonuclease family protein [Micromonospora zhanjiangensis]|uniref:HNH endonuclease family protein n=1 Tax=Micromonospora zhanjiangensis TaxID=1522057 RepID=A0ABV8KUH6_9ACTN